MADCSIEGRAAASEVLLSSAAAVASAAAMLAPSSGTSMDCRPASGEMSRAAQPQESSMHWQQEV